MSKRQYNLTNKTDYVNRKMFLDPAGPVTIQRFEEVKYNKIADYEKTARGFFWVPEEINLTKDANDFKDASAAVKHIFTSNLLRGHSLKPTYTAVRTAISFAISTTCPRMCSILSMTHRKL